MMRRQLIRAAQSARPPQPVRTIDAANLPDVGAIASIAISASLGSAMALLDLDAEGRSLVVVDHRALGMPGPRAVHALAIHLAAASQTTIAVPPDVSETEFRRWTSLASSSGATAIRLGAAGWNRVVFGDRSMVLEHADLPAELYEDASLLAISAPSGDGSLGLWGRIAHPNTSLRARVAPNATVELSVAVAARYVVVGQVGVWWIAGFAAPAIVAELLARGIERLRERLRGYETPGPWEDAGVQHLSALTESGESPINLALGVRLHDNAGEGIARRLGEMLGWKIELNDDPTGDNDGER